MTQQELHEKLKESQRIRYKAMELAEESEVLANTDFVRSNKIFLEGLELWNLGCEIGQRAIEEAIESGLMERTDE
jgi:hypothetical protein